jgi:hypothetical protein
MGRMERKTKFEKGKDMKLNKRQITMEGWRKSQMKNVRK